MQCAPQKIKKTSESLGLEMTRTTDILAHVSASTPRPFVVGFAAETNSIEQHARAKLMAKNLDMIAANEVGHTKAFDCDHNALLVLWRGGGRVELPDSSKTELAYALTNLIVERLREAGQAREGTQAQPALGATAGTRA
jgi:phosphopantothenoylcysteine decarboxylase/phosphopantothenate--cysteine ligase